MKFAFHTKLIASFLERRNWALLIITLASVACHQKETESPPLFSRLSSDLTHIDFRNDLVYDSKFNIYTYRNFYNGGGVALGDVNNDGLMDVYFSANQGPNKLYLNKGNFVFEDITKAAGVAGTKAWSTGVSMADVNGDGWTDIYVCNSGNVKGDDKENELFINNGDLTFTDRAQEYGVADRGYSTHAVFFDYDKDGDLDLYILNNSYQAIGSFNLKKNERGKRDDLGGHKLMRNDNGHFVDVSTQAGIYGSIIAFGLGVTVGDVNKDGWEDIYVSNDFFERDYLYINHQDGTFKERLTTSVKSISGASMGADLGDINNDAYPDLFVTEMLPRSNERLKTVTAFESWDKYQYDVSNDYYHQFARNMLQLNNQDGTFSEIGRLAHVEATDWSWGALIFDADNDGLKDIFVANGIYQDLTNQDYLQHASSEEFVKSILLGHEVDYKKLIDIIPSHPVPDFIFKNKGNFQFDDMTLAWGLGAPNFSNGSAYGDLDNDGDLDLIVNNVNSEAFVYRNESKDKQNHFLKFLLQGEGGNRQALGTEITITAGDKTFYLEQMPMRGFESSVDPRPNFGLGNLEMVDRVTVQWPDGRITRLDSVKTNQTISLFQKDGKHERDQLPIRPVHQFDSVTALSRGIDFKQTENSFVDFDRDRLTFHMLSTQGPKISVADVNGDGLDDFYIGGPSNQAGAIFLQTPGGKFNRSSQAVMEKDKLSEDQGSAFFDADGDGDLDLYVCSGGNEFPSGSSALEDRLYINSGRGEFTRSQHPLPTATSGSSSCVKPVDFDKDGDLDLFVGGRLVPFRYGLPSNGILLENDGHGQFRDATVERAPGLNGIGLVTDAQWGDIDLDGDPDLVVVGEWMPIQIFRNTNGKLEEPKKEDSGLIKSNGWWNTVVMADLDHDGDLDFVAGNHGRNSRFRASVMEPVSMYVSDFDSNGTIEQIICTISDGKCYPMALRPDLIQELPMLKKKYLKYDSYKDQTITDVFTGEQLQAALRLDAYNLSSCIGINDGKGKFTIVPLPVEAQLSPIFGVLVDDLDKDGNADIVVGGNLYNAKPEVGRYDASYGLYIKGDSKGNFTPVKQVDSGLLMDGQTRDIRKIRIGNESFLLIGRNSNAPVLFKIRK